MEGTRDKALAHQAFMEYLECAIGHVMDLKVTSDHNSNAFAVNRVRIFRSD